MEKFVRTSKLLPFFSAVPRIAVKLIVKDTDKTDVKLMLSGFSVTERGCVRVIVLFSSVQCLYSRHLQEGSRVKQ